MDDGKENLKGKANEFDSVKRIKAYYYQAFSDIEEISLLDEKFKKITKIDIEYLKIQIEVINKNHEELKNNNSLICENISGRGYKRYIKIIQAYVQKSSLFQDLVRRFKML